MAQWVKPDQNSIPRNHRERETSRETEGETEGDRERRREHDRGRPRETEIRALG